MRLNLPAPTATASPLNPQYSHGKDKSHLATAKLDTRDTKSPTTVRRLRINDHAGRNQRPPNRRMREQATPEAHRLSHTWPCRDGGVVPAILFHCTAATTTLPALLKKPTLLFSRLRLGSGFLHSPAAGTSAEERRNRRSGSDSPHLCFQVSIGFYTRLSSKRKKTWLWCSSGASRFPLLFRPQVGLVNPIPVRPTASVSIPTTNPPPPPPYQKRRREPFVSAVPH